MLKGLKYRFRKLRYRHSLVLSHFEPSISAIAKTFDIATSICSVACLICLVVYVGYNLKLADQHVIFVILRCCQGIFLASVFFEIFFRLKAMLRQSRIIKWIVDIALLFSLLPWIYPKPIHPWLPWLSHILYSPAYIFSVLGAFSLVNVCWSIARIPNRHTNPSLLMGASFLFFIIIGSFVLMLPRCTYHGISYFDSLFVASSAVCITGLTPVEINTTFTPLGVFMLSVLVQLGSLGLITFTSFFAIYFTGATSIYNQLLLRDIIYSKSMNALVPTLLYVLGFTVTIEVIGAFGVFFALPAELPMDTHQRVLFSGFHAMSSFCNAGFCCLPDGMSNPILMNSNQWIYVVTSILIFAGAIGFPILVNFKEILRFYLRKIWRKLRGLPREIIPLHIFDLNTKIVLVTTISILAVGSVAFFWLEYNNTLAGMSFTKKVVQSVFNSLIPRSAGFASVNPCMFLDATLFLVVVQMIIGGSSQSMAGGIKVNTLGAILLNLRSIIKGHKGITAFGRSINIPSVRRANAVITLAAVSLVAYITLEMILEPQIGAKSIIFEVVSALFTVGSSLGATPMLSDASKVVLCTAMFFGRVGLLSFLSGFITHTRDISEHLPKDSIIIN